MNLREPKYSLLQSLVKIIVGRIVSASAELIRQITNLVSGFRVTRNRRGDKGSFQETAGRWQQAAGSPATARGTGGTGRQEKWCFFVIHFGAPRADCLLLTGLHREANDSIIELIAESVAPVSLVHPFVARALNRSHRFAVGIEPVNDRATGKSQG